MKVYVRKMFPHDITHEVSVKTDIVEGFFEGNNHPITFKGILSGSVGQVTINNATDPRFGGDFKKILLDEGRADVNDILLIYKENADFYRLEIVKETDDRYFDLMVLFGGSNRHTFLENEEELLLTKRIFFRGKHA